MTLTNGAPRIDNFQVLSRMCSEYPTGIALAKQIVRMNKVRAGAEIVVGVPFEYMVYLADESDPWVGGLLLYRKSDFDALKKRMEAEAAPAPDAHLEAAHEERESAE